MGRLETTSPAPHDVTVSLCIPAIYDDLRDGLLSTTMETIARQTQIPDEVIIAVSETPKHRWDGVRLLLQQEGKHLNVIVLPTDIVQSPGQNRNRAVSVATGDVISFFDADDEMNPNRILLLSKAFEQNPRLKLALHGFTKRKERWSGALSYSNATKIYGEQMCEIEQESRKLHDWLASPRFHFTVTHGHASVRRNIALQYRFSSGMKGEDCHFVRRIMQDACTDSKTRHGSVLYLDLPLTRYESRKERGKRLKKSLPT